MDEVGDLWVDDDRLKNSREWNNQVGGRRGALQQQSEGEGGPGQERVHQLRRDFDVFECEKVATINNAMQCHLSRVAKDCE